MVHDPHRLERAGHFQIGKSAEAKIFTRSIGPRIIQLALGKLNCIGFHI